MLRYLVEEFRLPSKTGLLEQLEALVVDVTEQPIPKPKRSQKAYYSGKKKAYNESSNTNQPNIHEGAVIKVC